MMFLLLRALCLLQLMFGLVSAGLPPGGEDELWCPVGYCRRDKPSEAGEESFTGGMVGPASEYLECFNLTTGDRKPIKARSDSCRGKCDSREELVKSCYFNTLEVDCKTAECRTAGCLSGTLTECGSIPSTLQVGNTALRGQGNRAIWRTLMP